MTSLSILRLEDAVALFVDDRPMSDSIRGCIRLRFDRERSGWIIEQPRIKIVDPSPDETDPEPELIEDWAETAFLAAWARQRPGDLPWQDAAEDGLPVSG